MRWLGTFNNWDTKNPLVIVAIVTMRHWSQEPLQSPIQNVKNGVFWRNFGDLLNFFLMDGRRGLLIPVCFCPNLLKKQTADRRAKSYRVLGRKMQVHHNTVMSKKKHKHMSLSKFTHPVFTLKPGNNIIMVSSKNGQGLCANFNKRGRTIIR
jgi:hypothetical protein